MKQNLKTLVMSAISAFVLCSSALAQGTLEWTFGGNSTSGPGANTNPVTVTFLSDALNAPSNTVFSNYSPTLTATVTYRNQQLSTTLTNTTTVVPGLTFGGRTTSSIGPNNQQAIGSANFIYDVFGSEIPAGPVKNGMYMTSPTALPAAGTFQNGFFGAGFDPEGITGASGPDGGDANFGIAMYSSVEPLFDINADKEGRYYFGDLVISFNRPVKNPVIHIGGMGGSYTFQSISGAIKTSYFTTELELVNTGVTSTFMAGNEFFNVSGNNILNSSATPNAGSVNDGSANPFGINNYGAASGSVRINGTAQEVVYRVYVKGSNNSTLNFSAIKDSIFSVPAATRDPFNGDLWYLSVSLDKPTQQISGNVFIDRDGLTDNNINQSVGVANPKTNVGGALYANLLNAAGTTVIATVPVSSDGTYLFDNVATGDYKVQLTTVQGTPGQQTPATTLPTGWVNTGEFVGAGAGNDGSTIPANTANGINDISVTVASGDIKTEVNFGIERTPVSVPFSYIIPKPDGGVTLTLFGGTNNFAPLTGSDPEDQPATAPLTGKTVQITELPAAFSILRYNGVPVTAGQIIPNYDPSLLQIAFTGSTPTSFAEFKYSYLDAAGKPSVPTIYRLEWFGGPLAITISNFAAVNNNCTAALTWTTASEINASRFEIEVSSSNSAVYNKVGSVIATATNGSGKTYQFNYPMQPNTQYFFRLKMMDKDGSFKYSDVRPLTSCTGKAVITIAPNPVTDKFVISGMESGKNTIVVYAANGQQVKTQIIPQAQGYVYIQNLAAGMYSVKVISEKGNVTVGKIVKH